MRGFSTSRLGNETHDAGIGTPLLPAPPPVASTSPPTFRNDGVFPGHSTFVDPIPSEGRECPIRLSAPLDPRPESIPRCAKPCAPRVSASYLVSTRGSG